MTKTRVKVRKEDYCRVVLTEVMPFELPIFVSNYNFYKYLSKHGRHEGPDLVKRALGRDGTKPDLSIPLNLRINRGQGKKRSIAIPHPKAQIRTIDFYRDWGQVLVDQCQKSKFSLRYPSQVGSIYFERQFADYDVPKGDDTGDMKPGESSTQRVFASSYFYYEGHNQIWKFFSSQDFRSLEKRFQLLRKIDVSKCFASIYTHSISWAVKGKFFSKSHINSYAFSEKFDQLMQYMNWRETNGILVGPEISRLFAEVIFQQIDVNISNHLMRKSIPATSFEIRRYIDDFFVFSKDATTADEVEAVIEEELEIYKLSLNESKRIDIHAPLETNLSIARQKIRKILNEEIKSKFNHDLVQLQNGEKTRPTQWN